MPITDRLRHFVLPVHHTLCKYCYFPTGFVSAVVDDLTYYLTHAGAAHMLSVTAFGGTARVSGLRLIRELETMGAQISSSSDREKVIVILHHSP